MNFRKISKGAHDCTIIHFSINSVNFKVKLIDTLAYEMKYHNGFLYNVMRHCTCMIEKRKEKEKKKSFQIGQLKSKNKRNFQKHYLLFIELYALLFTCWRYWYYKINSQTATVTQFVS